MAGKIKIIFYEIMERQFKSMRFMQTEDSESTLKMKGKDPTEL